MVFTHYRRYVNQRKWQSQAMRTTAWMQDDSRDGGGRQRPEYVLEVRLNESNRYDHVEVGGSECQEHILERFFWAIR